MQRYTAESIGAMTDADAKSVLDALAQAFFTKTSWAGAMAAYIEMTPRAVRLWMEPGKRPPAWAILLIQAEAEAVKHLETLEKLADVVGAVADLKAHP